MINQISDWLFQGDVESVTSGEYKTHQITAIISVTEDDLTFKYIDKLIPYLWIPFSDWGDELDKTKLYMILSFAKLVHNWHELTEEHGKLLVHCYAGSNRSSAITAYILNNTGELARVACQIVHDKNPHMGIEQKLTKKLFELTGKTFKNP